MRPSAVFWKVLVILAILQERDSHGDNLWKHSNKTEILSASYMEMFGRSKKRKRGYELCTWNAHSREDKEGFPQSKRHVCVDYGLGVWEQNLAFERCIDTMVGHDRESKDDLSSVCDVGHGSVDQGPSRGKHIPVNKLIGQGTVEMQLQHLLLDPNAERVAIQGTKGIGKTTLMKHMHNYALNLVGTYDYVFWVTCPPVCSSKGLQDYVAVAITCDLSSIHDTTLRAKKLFETLVSRGRTVIFLDGVSAANISYITRECIGIPFSSQGSSCKIVITTSRPLACGLLSSFQTVQVDPLSEKEALGLFMIEAGIDFGQISQLNDVPKLLSGKCCGVPRVIVETATCMRGIVDVCEWRHRVNLGIRNEVSSEVLITELGCDGRY